ncbi:hypothetical protein [Burkholderia ambifaria]|uniref:hypothetical protein n=1 Tax=Burkholderia ambifaria TaxID=152480 RepID=UPI001588D8B5|nr:hypothetical protein [Burkholderia ambifaria]
MKITDDMLTEVEPIVAQWIRERGTSMDGASYGAALELAAYVASRRTTPDREAIIEQCARVCDARYMGDNNREDMEARRCAQAIRALKITANGEKK